MANSNKQSALGALPGAFMLKQLGNLANPELLTNCNSGLQLDNKEFSKACEMLVTDGNNNQ